MITPSRENNVKEETLEVEDSDKDQALEYYHEETNMEESCIQFFIEEVKGDDISSPMIQEGSTLENKDEGSPKCEFQHVRDEG